MHCVHCSGPPVLKFCALLTLFLKNKYFFSLFLKNQQCTARARTTGNRCLNPAAFGCKTCRYHGARRQNTIKTGKNHPNFRHGRENLCPQCLSQPWESNLRRFHQQVVPLLAFPCEDSLLEWPTLARLFFDANT